MSATGTPAAAPATTAAPAATTTPATTTTPAAAPAAFDWNAQGLDADTATYVAGKGFKTPGDVVTSYRNAEKLIGAAPESVVKIPTGEFNQELFNSQVADKLGRPKEPTGYELTKLVPTGGDTKFAEAAASKFHQEGLTARQAQNLTKWWNEQAGGMTAATTEAQKLKNTQEISSLKAEWGQAFDSNAALVDKAAASFSMTPAQVEALKTAMGPKGAMTFLHNIGLKLGVSDTFVAGDTRESNFAGGMTTDQAKVAIAELKKDKDFMSRYVKNESEAKAKMSNLMARAYPGTLTI